MTARKIGYARVSTDKQTTDTQVSALKKAGCCTVFTDDGVSGTTVERTGLAQAKEMLRENDVFVVTAIDRVFRSTIQAISFLDDLMKRGVDFQSLAQNIDTKTPEGRKWFVDSASWAEYERAIISRRTKERLAYVKSQGKHLGRPFKLSECRIHAAHRRMSENAETLETAAKRLNVSPLTLRRGFERLALE